MKKIKEFYVIVEDNGTFKPYDIMWYLLSRYKALKKADRPTERKDILHFIEKCARYQWWARCEYEIIISDWPCQQHTEKWDVYKQVHMNIEVITDIFIENINK